MLTCCWWMLINEIYSDWRMRPLTVTHAPSWLVCRCCRNLTTSFDGSSAILPPLPPPRCVACRWSIYMYCIVKYLNELMLFKNMCFVYLLICGNCCPILHFFSSSNSPLFSSPKGGVHRWKVLHSSRSQGMQNLAVCMYIHVYARTYC